MNDTKWRKLRLAMLDLSPLTPSYRLLHVEYGETTGWDGEWFYHFNLPTYRFIERLDLQPYNVLTRPNLHEVLKRLHLPGEETSLGYSIYGYSRGGRHLDYIS
jgi:hypothetical protein